MGKWCVCYGCTTSKDIPLFSFPGDPTRSRKWDRFVCQKRKDWSVGKGTPKQQVCALHFETDMFTNYQQWNSGYAERLRLVGDAIPSVHHPSLSGKGYFFILKKDISKSTIHIHCCQINTFCIC